MQRTLIVIFAVLSLCLPLAASRHRAVRSAPPVPVLNLERSFAITDKATLEGFRFERVLDALAERSGVPGMTGEKLFRQWFDTQNPAPGLDASMPHCDDQKTNGAATLNDFAIACPADGGSLATSPFQPDAFIPIGIFNRFDQANGSNCGQYRIIFAQQRPAQDEVFHLIFEAALPNPDPDHKLSGCYAAARFWADLSDVPSRDERRRRLEQFFFEGIAGFAPAIHPDHYHGGQAGIRTLQITHPSNLIHFFQYRLIHECNGSQACRMYMKQDVLENTTTGAFFDARNSSPRAVAFREHFLTQIPTLVSRNVNLYSVNLDSSFLVADSQPTAEGLPGYSDQFQQALTSTQGLAFRDRIADAARQAGSTLDARTIVLRAVTLGCGGCHVGGADVGEGIQFPLGGGIQLQHVTEDRLVSGEGGPQSRYPISPAMQNVFIPHRMQILRDYLLWGTAPVHSN